MLGDSKKSIVSKKLVISSIIVGILLVLVNSAVWVNRELFDTENFTTTAVTAVTSESSRQAIGARVVDEVLKDRPVIKNVVGDRASNLIGGLLGTEQVRSLLSASMSRLQVYVTSNEQQDVDIELTGLKTILTRVVEVSGREDESRISPSEVPDRIVLIEEETIPDIYKIGVILSWFAVISLVVIVGLIALPYRNNRKNYLAILTFQGASVALIGLASLLIGPLFKPPFLESFRNSNGRMVASNLYDAFIATFNAQTAVLIGAGLTVCLIAGTIRVYPQLKLVLKQSKVTSKK